MFLVRDFFNSEDCSRLFNNFDPEGKGVYINTMESRPAHEHFRHVANPVIIL